MEEGVGGGGMGGQLPRISCSGRNYSEKNVRAEKSREILLWREFHGGSCPGWETIQG